METDLPDRALAVWRDAGLAGLGLRPPRADDLDAVATALLRGEGYTHDGPEPETFASIRQGLAGFGDSDERAGLVVTQPGEDTPSGFLLYRLRNRLADDFGADRVLCAMPVSRFPAGGRFLHIHDLWVDPALRRRGVARTLKQIVELVAAKHGVGMVYTVTEATHRAALALNAGLGYVEIFRGPMWDHVERVGLAKYLR